MLIFEQRASTILYNFFRGLKSEKQVILPANICPIVPATLAKAGQSFSFVDISLDTYALNFSACHDIIKNSNIILAIIYVHPYGDPNIPVEAFTKLKLFNPNIIIIDDRCLCYPEFKEPSMDNVDMILFSTGYAKPIDVGFGGYAWLKDSCNYKRFQLPYKPGDLISFEDAIKEHLSNRQQLSKIDTDWLVTSSFPLSQDVYFSMLMEELEKIQIHKTNINKMYSSRLPISIQMPKVFQSWRFNLLTNKKEQILTELFKAELFASSHYASLGGIFGSGNYPNSDYLHRHIINLFNDRYYTIEKAERTVDIINCVLSTEQE